MDRKRIVKAQLIAVLALVLAACQPAAVAPQVERPDLELAFGEVGLLEAVWPEAAVAEVDPDSRTVVVSYTMTNNTAADIGAADFPAIQLFNQAGGAHDSDMRFTPAPDGQMTNDWPASIAPGATVQASEIFTIPARDWTDGQGWTVGWRGSAPDDRRPVAG